MLDLNGKTPEELAQVREQAINLLHALENKRVDAKDEEVVWIENAAGRREVIKFGYWRKYLRRHTELNCRLLDPDEIEAEEQKVAQAEALRTIRAEKKKAESLEGATVSELFRKIEELESQVESGSKGKRKKAS